MFDNLFYRIDGQKVDGYIAVDLSFVEGILRATGPVFLAAYNEEITAINVYDLGGRVVKQITPNQTEVEVNMSELAAAMYIVKVNAGGNQTEIKVIKK